VSGVELDLNAGGIEVGVRAVELQAGLATASLRHIVANLLPFKVEYKLVVSEDIREGRHG
jgi:hypothetical protein